jgi:hypothetical protein
MAAPAYVFTLADVRDLSRNLNANLSRDDGGGFSYPQRGWVYEAARAYHEHHRSASALEAAVETALGRGNGLTPWKRTEAERLRSKLASFVSLDRTARGRYVRSVYRYPPRNVIWQGHALRLPLGFVCEEGGHLFLRTLWMEAALRPSRRGITMVVAATFAAAREEIPSLAAIETWHLRDTERRFYPEADLSASLKALDRALSLAESRITLPPAAA